jgi:hypothetical protein
MVSRRDILKAGVGAVLAGRAEGQPLPFHRGLIRRAQENNAVLPDEDRQLLRIVGMKVSHLKQMGRAQALELIESLFKTQPSPDPNVLISVPTYALDGKTQVLEKLPVLNYLVDRFAVNPEPQLKEMFRDMADALIRKGADVNRKSTPQRWQSPLVYAALKNQTDMVALLLTRKADVKSVDADGNTALHYAYQNGNEQVIGMLKTHGASEHHKNNRNETPSMLRSRKPNPNLLAQHDSLAENERDGRA